MKSSPPKLVRVIDELPHVGLIFYLNIYNLNRVLPIMPHNSYFTFDGIGLCSISSLIIRSKIERLAPDFGGYFQSLLHSKKKKILIGGKPREAVELGKNLKNVIGVSHGYLEEEEILQFVQGFSEMKDENILVIVGLGSPRQELIGKEILSSFPRSQIIVCGAFFSQYARQERYFPPIINKLHLRMPYRLFKEGLYSRLPYYFLNPFRFFIAVVRKEIVL